MSIDWTQCEDRKPDIGVKCVLHEPGSGDAYVAQWSGNRWEYEVWSTVDDKMETVPFKVTRWIYYDGKMRGPDVIGS